MVRQGAPIPPKASDENAAAKSGSQPETPALEDELGSEVAEEGEDREESDRSHESADCTDQTNQPAQRVSATREELKRMKELKSLATFHEWIRESMDEAVQRMPKVKPLNLAGLSKEVGDVIR